MKRDTYIGSGQCANSGALFSTLHNQLTHSGLHGCGLCGSLPGFESHGFDHFESQPYGFRLL